MSFEFGEKQRGNKLLPEQIKVALLVAPFLALPHTELYAIEIPQDASYEKGVSILKESAGKDEHEVAAIYVCVGNKCAWFSTEGEEKSVDVGKLANKLTPFLKKHENSAEAKDAISMQVFHTHPKKVIQKFMEGRYQKHFTFQFKNFFSFPPSAGDVLSASLRGVEFNLAVSGVSKVDTMVNKVVDASGIWTYKVDESKNAKQDINKESESTLGDISKYQLAWFIKSQKVPVEQMLQDGSLDKLKMVYKHFGVDLKYELH